MFSAVDAEGVLSALGDKFLLSFAASVGGARTDIEDMRQWRPGWFPNMHSRCLSNLIHDRIWAHLVTEVESLEAVVAVEKGPTRQLQVGRNFLLRIKRHHPGNRISSYPTEGALSFYLQPQTALPGLELITLAAGYWWDDELRAIRAPVLSYRDGKENPIWAVELDEPQQGATTIGWTPVGEPNLPSVDFGDADETGEEGSTE